MQGSYIGGIYYPDKTKVGWWKIGYPKYYAKIINSVNWIGIDIKLDGQSLDLAKSKVIDFKRSLKMKEGVLERSFAAQLQNGYEVEVHAQHFISMDRKEVGAIEYSIKALNFNCKLSIAPYINGDVQNEIVADKYFMDVRLRLMNTS